MAGKRGKGMSFWKHGMSNAISAECWEDFMRKPLSLEKGDPTGVSWEVELSTYVRAKEGQLRAVHA